MRNPVLVPMPRWLTWPALLLALVAGAVVLLHEVSLPLPMEMEEAFEDLDEQVVFLTGDPPLTLSYRRCGNQEALRIVFVHGSPGTSAAWAHFLAAPSAKMEFLAYDRPGFGDSWPRRAVLSLSEQARALRPFLVQRQGSYPVLVGHSLGGPIICQAALDYPDRVAGLVIISGSLDPGLEESLYIQHMAQWGFLPSVLPRFMVNANRELLSLESQLEMLASRLDEIQCPIYILHGAQDDLVTV